IFVSLELSRSTWLITSLSPCAGEKMSKHGVAAGDIGALLALFGVQAEGVCANREIFPDHRHSGGGIGRLLDSPRVAERRDRKPRRRSGLDCDLASASAGENRSDRRRGASTRAAGL